MNERLEQYFAEKKKEQEELRNKKKIELLFQEDLYEKIPIEENDAEGNHNLEAEWDYETSSFYQKVPIDITDEEYEQLKKVCAVSDESENQIAKALTVIAWIIYIGGFFAGILFGLVEVNRGSYYTYTDTTFSFALAFSYWAICFVAGTMFLGFAEIIKLLEEIKRK